MKGLRWPEQSTELSCSSLMCAECQSVDPVALFCAAISQFDRARRSRSMTEVLTTLILLVEMWAGNCS